MEHSTRERDSLTLLTITVKANTAQAIFRIEKNPKKTRVTFPLCDPGWYVHIHWKV